MKFTVKAYREAAYKGIRYTQGQEIEGVLEEIEPSDAVEPVKEVINKKIAPTAREEA